MIKKFNETVIDFFKNQFNERIDSFYLSEIDVYLSIPRSAAFANSFTYQSMSVWN